MKSVKISGKNLEKTQGNWHFCKKKHGKLRENKKYVA